VRIEIKQISKSGENHPTFIKTKGLLIFLKTLVIIYYYDMVALMLQYNAKLFKSSNNWIVMLVYMALYMMAGYGHDHHAFKG
jgi:hypothetical protein